MRIATLLTTLVLVVGGCGGKLGAEAGSDAMTVAEMTASSDPGDSVEFTGEVSLLGELFCPCFEVTSDDESVIVWYDLMVDEDVPRPAVDVTGIENGDTVRVRGTCQEDPDPGTGFMVVWATAIARSQ